MLVLVWGAALFGYGAFWLWYVGLARPLGAAEIDGYLARLQDGELPVEPQQLETMRAFLEADDGREVFMINLVALERGRVTAPGSESPQRPSEVLDGYTKHFMPALLRRAGHPAFFGRAAGGYVERWNVGPDPGWSFGAAIRYRSRRDMIELTLDPRFAGAHAFKRAAIATTFAFPATPGFVVAGPKIWVGLALALLAALAQIGLGAAGVLR